MRVSKSLNHQFLFALFLVMALSTSPGFGQDMPKTYAVRFTVYGGVSLPVGDFAATDLIGVDSPGLAKTGATFGLDVTSELDPGFDIGGSFAVDYNPVDVTPIEQIYGNGASVHADPWRTYSILGSVGFRKPLMSDVEFHGAAYLGAMIGILPAMTITYPGSSAPGSSKNGAAMEFGLGAGVLIHSRYDIRVRYLAGEPAFSLNGNASGTSVTQPMSRLQLTVGVVVF